jgi:hypothetical protein
MSITPSRTPSATSPPIPITAFYYSNQEYSDGTVFLDGNLAVNKNGGNIINEVFTTPGDVLYTGGTIYQDDSIFAQASGNISTYPKPAYGTSTRRLLIKDSAGNTINDVSVDYDSSTNKTFTVVGGRTYYVRGYTNFIYPSSATLTINGFFNNSGYYYFAYDLSTGVEGTITINAFSIISDAYYTSDCSGYPDDYVQSQSDATISKGQYGIGYVSTGFPYTGYASQKIRNQVQINGSTYSNGSTFTLGATTVTVSINRFCQSV